MVKPFEISRIRTAQELEVAMGENIRALRLQRNLSQESIAQRAGVSLGTIRNLEAGSGSSTSTLAKVLNVLGKGEAFANLARVPTVDPYSTTRDAQQRQRAPRSTRVPTLPHAQSKK
jgi:transcriptional regulator with XRE-family HTH domain